ncbi:MAG: hypothetical protein HXX11_02950 [Desulfuromonadales bacterium]|nr:hypothetical protein [Desulfuromonadales bacterium]
MPELPEVESVLRALRDSQPSLVGCRIGQTQVLWEGVLCGWSVADFQNQLQGSMIATAGRQGKYLYFGLDGPGKRRYLVVHLRMTGT